MESPRRYQKMPEETAKAQCYVNSVLVVEGPRLFNLLGLAGIKMQLDFLLQVL